MCMGNLQEGHTSPLRRNQVRGRRDREKKQGAEEKENEENSLGDGGELRGLFRCTTTIISSD